MLKCSTCFIHYDFQLFNYHTYYSCHHIQWCSGYSACLHTFWELQGHCFDSWLFCSAIVLWFKIFQKILSAKWFLLSALSPYFRQEMHSLVLMTVSVTSGCICLMSEALNNCVNCYFSSWDISPGLWLKAEGWSGSEKQDNVSSPVVTDNREPHWPLWGLWSRILPFHSFLFCHMARWLTLMKQRMTLGWTLINTEINM